MFWLAVIDRKGRSGRGGNSLPLTPCALRVFWNIVLLDRETKEGNHRAIQKSIERVVEKESYEWQTLMVQEDGKIKVE
jgi:hypothetical protein